MAFFIAARTLGNRAATFCRLHFDVPWRAFAFLISRLIQPWRERSLGREVERGHSTRTGGCHGVFETGNNTRHNYYLSEAGVRKTSLESTHTLISFYVELMFGLCSASIVEPANLFLNPSWSCFMWNVAHYYLICRHTLAVVVPAMRKCIRFTVPCTVFFFFRTFLHACAPRFCSSRILCPCITSCDDVASLVQRDYTRLETKRERLGEEM